MDPEVQPPLFLHCIDGSVLMFGCAVALTRYVESPDVESGEYAGVYDAFGRKCLLDVERPTDSHEFLGILSIELSPVLLRPTDELQPEALAALLAAQLKQSTNDLASLVDEARRTWPER